MRGGARAGDERGASPDGSGSRFPLLGAAQNGHVEVIDLLAEAGAKVVKKNSKRETALHWAAQWGTVEANRCLLALGLDPELRSKNR